MLRTAQKPRMLAAMNAFQPIAANEAGALTPLPRARGEVRVASRRVGEQNVLSRLRQQGAAKAMTPRHGGDDFLAILLNTAGGVTGGDWFTIDGEAEAGAWLTLASQTAERAYRARPGEVGRIDVTLRAAAGARIDWLPQETILFEGAAFGRRIEVDLSEDAVLLAVEPIILGRAAMGERVTRLAFRDNWRVRRAGRLVYADALRLDGPETGLATLGANAAFATILYAAPDAESRLAELRGLTPEIGGASLIRDGVLAARLAAPSGFALRRGLLPALERLRGAPLPRTWTM